MLSNSDLALLEKRGISVSQLENQLLSFKKGFPWLKIISAATPDKGLLQLDATSVEKLVSTWDSYLNGNNSILKFVPASGAASRMFKDLFEFLESELELPLKPAEIQFFDKISKFAFYPALNEICIKNEGKNIPELMQLGQHKTIVSFLLSPDGLNYGNLPKGLLLFHHDGEEKRTPVQEHLVEGALYAMNKNREVNIHFTVSAEHKALFEAHLKKGLHLYTEKFNALYAIGFSVQKPSTDTVAGDENNEPFRDKDQMVFRPGGHGALIANLNDLDADVIFIKNIDNVVPDKMKNITVDYKKVIAGLLVDVQAKCFQYLQALEDNQISDKLLSEISDFNQQMLNNLKEDIALLSKDELISYLKAKLNRPIRVCGMVKNTGEPGGGPFLTVNQDGTVSPQILESSQIDLKNPAEKDKMMQSTHFNPVDLVCGVKNYKGEKFDLTQFVDVNTGFISSKSKNGKELKALELPGLWNGAMSDWNTIFVEVPIETFNPVKTVNDLLRPEHQ